MKNLPDKIYLNFDLTEEEYNELDFNDLFSEEVTWSDDDVQGRNVEYVRKDTFIEEVCEFLNLSSILRNTSIVEKFRNYMKGE